MAFELGQVERGRRALRDLGLGAVEDVEAEVEQSAGHLLAVDGDVALGQMPSARAHHQHGGIALESVSLARNRVGEVDFARPAVLQVGLALDHIGEHRRGRVLEIRHEHPGARVQRVDDHLAVDRAGDLDPAVQEIGRDRRDGPVALADGFRVGKKVRQFASVEIFLALHSPHQKLKAPPIEAAMQTGHERKRLRGEDLGLPAAGLGVDLDAGLGRMRCHGVGLQRRGGLKTQPRPFRRPWGGPGPMLPRPRWARLGSRDYAARSVRAMTAFPPGPAPDQEAGRVVAERQRRRVVDVGPGEADVAQLIIRHSRELRHRPPRRADPGRPGEDAPEAPSPATRPCGNWSAWE